MIGWPALADSLRYLAAAMLAITADSHLEHSIFCLGSPGACDISGIERASRRITLDGLLHRALTSICIGGGLFDAGLQQDDESRMIAVITTVYIYDYHHGKAGVMS